MNVVQSRATGANHHIGKEGAEDSDGRRRAVHKGANELAAAARLAGVEFFPVYLVRPIGIRQ